MRRTRSCECFAKRDDPVTNLRVVPGADRIRHRLGRGERGACGADVARRDLGVPPVAEKVRKPQLVADPPKQGLAPSERFAGFVEPSFPGQQFSEAAKE